MSELITRLQQLRRDAGVIGVVSATAPLSAIPEASILQRLRRLLDVRNRAEPTVERSVRGEEIAAGLRYVETTSPYEVLGEIELPLPGKPMVSRERLLCFDTETTGLTRGVGTRAFMIGVASFAQGEVRTRQLYMTTMAAEKAMLETFSSWISTETILVSYNGKSYDAPLLKGRYRLNRLPHLLDSVPHVDWLYATRRAYRDKLINCRLATIEREVLRIARENDLSGSQAPAAWLRYLRGGSSEGVTRVLEHNRQDVVTLIRLGDHLSSQMGQRGATSPSPANCV